MNEIVTFLLISFSPNLGPIGLILFSFCLRWTEDRERRINRGRERVERERERDERGCSQGIPAFLFLPQILIYYLHSAIFFTPSSNFKTNVHPFQCQKTPRRISSECADAAFRYLSQKIASRRKSERIRIGHSIQMSSIQISEIDQCMNLLRESERERERVRVCVCESERKDISSSSPWVKIH